jgi:hypothetical protein
MMVDEYRGRAVVSCKTLAAEGRSLSHDKVSRLSLVSSRPVPITTQ